MPINITAPDPLTAAYKATIAILKANAAFVAAYRRLNDYSDGKLEKTLQNLSAQDTPEISITQGAFVLKPSGGNSKTAGFTKTYNIVITTDTLQVGDVNELEYSAAAAFQINDPESVTWAGSHFISNYTFTNGADGTGGIVLPGTSNNARGVDRLSAIASVTYEIYVPRTSLPV